MDSTTKDRILLESLSLFAKHGYDSIGVSEIVKRCGVTKPTLYYYFESKENLLKCIVAHFSEELRQLVQEASESQASLAERLGMAADRYLRFSSGNPDFIRLYLSLVFTPHENRAYGIAKAEAEQIQTVVESLFEADDGFREQKRLFAASFIGQMNMFAALILNGYTHYVPELAITIVTMFLNGAGSIL